MVPVTRLWAPRCCLLLCLLAGNVSGSCNMASAGECRDALSVPGASLAGSGYDVVTLQSKAASVIDVNTWGYANGSCVLCRNRLLSGALQRLPLSLVDWGVHRRCRRSVSSRLYRSAAELVESAASMISDSWKVGLELGPQAGATGGWVLGGSHSKLAAFGLGRARADRYSFARQEFLCRKYRYRVRSQPLLSPEFARALGALPPTWGNDSDAEYRDLVQTYGTHFVQEITLGGRVREVSAIQTCKVALSGASVEEVLDCLGAEARVRVGFVTASAGWKRCRELATSMAHRASMSLVFADREVEVFGGTPSAGSARLDVFSPGSGRALTRWADSLDSQPGAVGYGLRPLHRLLPAGDARYPALRDYLGHYIGSNALARRCAGCPPGSSRPQGGASCPCYCAGDPRVDRQCCPKGKGVGGLTVKVGHGHDLWGDTLSRTDGYVVVKFGPSEARTSVILNNNNPSWDAELDLGEAIGGTGTRLVIQAWDSDAVTRDDLLGECKETLISGTHPKTCYLKYGKVTYSYTFTCAPHLGGPACQDYAPRPDGAPFDAVPGPSNATLLPVFPVPPPEEGVPPSVALA